MNSDGTLEGYDIEMTAAVSSAVTVPVVASGGAGKPEHMLRVLQEGKADAALAAYNLSLPHLECTGTGEGVSGQIRCPGAAVRDTGSMLANGR